MFGGGGTGRAARNGPMKGANVGVTVRLTFEEAVFGCKREVKINYKDECPTCHGSGAKAGTSPTTCPKCNGKGQIRYSQQTIFGTMQNVKTCPDCGGSGKIIKDKCPDCHGNGYVQTKKNFEVNIPAGVDNGMSVRVAGGGEPGTNGGPRGDLLVEVLVSPHPIFKRQDTNIYSTVPISFTKAALGGSVRVKTVDGEVDVSVKAGTQTDSRVRLKGKGVPSLRNKNVRGDHYITLVVSVPTKLTREQKAALEAFDAAMNK